MAISELSNNTYLCDFIVDNIRIAISKLNRESFDNIIIEKLVYDNGKLTISYYYKDRNMHKTDTVILNFEELTSMCFMQQKFEAIATVIRSGGIKE